MIARRYLLPLIMISLAPLTLCGQEWPQFRGPDGQGRANVRHLPTMWSEESDNIVWKTAVRGLGWSSPVVDGDELWITTADDEGRSLRAICLNVRDGKLLRDIEVFRQENAGRVHSKNSFASPTPILAKDRLYVHFGAFGTAGLSREGKVLWRQKLEYNQVHGPGGSPQLYGDLLVINCDGGDSAFVVALDAKTGEPRWRTDRPENSDKKFAFSTPLPIDVDGATELVSAGAGAVAGYDPATGRELWHVRYGDGYSVVPRPAFGHGLVFISSGYDRPVLYAIRPGGKGDVSDSHVAWTLDRGAPLNPSPLLVGDELYLVSDQGVATCLDARSGKTHWQKRLGGNFSASPLFGDGKIYLLNETGTMTVLSPGKDYRELATNTLDGRTLATPALVDGAVVLRTDSHVYRIGR